MRKMFTVITVIYLIFVAYYIGSPYITAYNIKDSIITNDPDKLSENVNFPLLGQNLKERLNLLTLESSSGNFQENPSNVEGVALNSTIDEGFIESIISPYGILYLIQSTSINLGRQNDELLEGQPEKPKDLFSNPTCDYIGIYKFAFSIPTKDPSFSTEAVLYLKRDGLTWKLTDIKFPFAEFFENTMPEKEDLADRFPKKENIDSDAIYKLTTHDVNSRFVDSDSHGRLFVVWGRVRNGYSESRKMIRLQCKLFSSGRVLAKSEFAYAGVNISDEELSSAAIPDIKKQLNAGTDQGANTAVAPGSSVAFLVVFSELPKDLDEYTIELISSLSAGS